MTVSQIRPTGGQSMETFEKAPHLMMAQVRAGRLTHGDLFAYLTIAELAFQQGGEVNLPQAKLAAACACQPRMLRHYLTDLIETGWIIARKIGVGRICAYRPAPVGTVPTGNILPLGRLATPALPAKSCRSNGNTVPVDRQNIAAVKEQTPDRPEKTGKPESGDPVSGSVANATAAPTQPTLSLDGPPRPVPKPLPAEQLAQTPPPPPTPAPAPQRKATVQSRLVDLLRDGGVPKELTPSDRDFNAVVKRGLPVELVAACYLDVFHGRYGDRFMQQRLTVQRVCYEYLDGYLATRAQPAAPSPTGTGDRAHFFQSRQDGRAADMRDRPYDGSRHGGLPDDMQADLANTKRH